LKTKEKIVKLIVIFLTTVFFSLLFSMGYEIQAVTITGGVVDENGSPIQGITVNYGGSNDVTAGDGTYRLEGSGDIITYNFSGEDKYEAESATSEYFTPQSGKKYNIVLVKPESGYENEYQEIENMLSNCDVNQKEAITYSDSGFTANPKKVLGNIYNTTQKNIIIVLGTENMPEVNFGIGSSNPPIIYKVDEGTADQVKGTVRVINNAELLQEYVEKRAELTSETTTLETENSESNVTVKIKYPDKNQRITLKLKKKEEPEPIEPSTPGLYIGNKITGTVLDRDNNPVKGVKVELCDKDGNTISAVTEQRTDENGNYTLSNVPGAGWDEANLEVIPIDYVVKFTYGDEEQFKESGTTQYNGNDYEAKGQTKNITEEVITNVEYEDVPEVTKKPDETENDKVDIYMVLDCSGSMNYNLDRNVKPAAKNFANAIYNEYGENARIGLIAFNDREYDMSDLVSQDRKDELIAGIDSMVSQGATLTHLGINKAVDKMAYESTDGRKKVIIVLTDGVSCSPLFTRESYIRAEAQGNNILTILYNMGTLTDEWETFINNNIGAGQVVHSEGADIISFLGENVVRFVKGEEIGEGAKPSTVPIITTETVTKTVEIGAKDDPGRREDTKNALTPIDYAKGIQLKKLDEYNSSDNYNEVCNLTQMTATGIVTMDSLDINNDQVEKKMDLILEPRQKITPKLKKEVESVKITLADGNVLIYKEGASDSPNDIGTMIVNDDKQYIAVMDDELLHGATMEIKYEVSIGGGNWDIENSTYTVYDYIDKELSFDKKRNTEWDIVTDKSNIGKNEEEKTAVADKVIIKTELNKDKLAASFVVTRLLTTNSTDEYENYVEVVEYSNNLGRRIYDTRTDGSKLSYVPADLPLKDLYDGGLDMSTRDGQGDEAEAPLVNIIPPFGEESKSFEKIIKYMYERKNFSKYLKEVQKWEERIF